MATNGPLYQQGPRDITCWMGLPWQGDTAWYLSGYLSAERLATDRLTAFYAILQSSEDTDRDSRTWIEACPGGWWYSVLLPTNGRLFAYLTDLDLADKHKLLSISGFLEQLAQTRHLNALVAEHRYDPF